MRDVGSPLEGLRVLELDDSLATTFAGWWLAELGAAVYYLDSDGAPSSFTRRLRSGARPHTDGSDEKYDVAIAELAPEKRTDGIGAELLGDTPLVRIVSPTRPSWEQQDSLVDDIRIWARSGLASLTHDIDDPTRSGPVRFPNNRQPSLLAGTAAAIAAIALCLPDRQGREGPREIVLDKLELHALLPMQPVATAQLEGRVVGGADGVAYPGGVMAARDGYVYVRPVEPAQWHRLLGLAGDLGWASIEALSDRRFLLEARELIDEPLRRWVSTRTKSEIVRAAQAHHVPLAPLNSPADVLTDEHLNARGFFEHSPDSVAITVPWHASIGASGRRSNAPRPPLLVPGRRLPLEGLRILDLTWAWAGPFATTLLADLGAEVINIEWDPRASNMRTQPAFAAGNDHSPDASGWWSANQRGKLSVGVNLKSDAGRDIIHQRASISEAVVENFSPGVVERLQIGYDDLLKDNEALVFVSMSAFGKTGPNAHYVGYGPHLLAASGTAFCAGPKSGNGVQMLIPYPDPVSGMAGALATLAYVYAARASGRPAFVDVSDLEATCCVIADALTDGAGDDGDAPEATESVEPLILGSADGTFFVVMLRDEAEWQACAETLSAGAATRGSLVEAARRLTDRSLADRLTAAGIPFDRVQDTAQVLHDPYLSASGFWLPDESPELFNCGARIGGPPWRVDGRRPDVWRGSPRLFEDTTLVLSRLLNRTASEIAALTGSGATKMRPNP